MASSPKRSSRVRTKPRISANDLARYMLSREAGKVGIIRRAKTPPTNPIIRYQKVKDVLKRSLANPERARAILETARDSFEQELQDTALSTNSIDIAEKSIDVLDAWHTLSNQIPNCTFEIPPNRQPLLNISCVEVSVNLDLIVKSTHRNEKRVGGLIFRLTKPEEEETDAAATKRNEMGAYVSTLVHMQVSENFVGDRIAHKSLCWSVDVQNQNIHKAPRNTQRRQNDMEAACLLIASSWDAL